ncbi:hypothetical protein OROHE_009618 [Orobanche hederae]
MSYNNNSNIPICLLIVALVYAGAAPFADAATFTVKGRFCCTDTGNCVDDSVGVAGAPVSLRCLLDSPRSIPTVVANATTDAAGNFVLSSTIDPFSGSVYGCDAVVQLPLTRPASVSCPLLRYVDEGELNTRVSITNGGLMTGIATAVFDGVFKLREYFGPSNGPCQGDLRINDETAGDTR